MNKQDFSIRDARAQDIDEMVELLEYLFCIEDDFTFNKNRQRHGLAALLADHERSIVKVAEQNSRVVGLCTAQISISTAEGGLSSRVEDLIVHKKFRKQGVATALLQHIHSWAVSAGCVRMQLLADIRNENALGFYTRRGWIRTKMVCLNKNFAVHNTIYTTPSRRINSRR